MNTNHRVLHNGYMEDSIDENMFPDSTDDDKKHIPYIFKNNQDKFAPYITHQEDYFEQIKSKTKTDFRYFYQNANNFNDYNNLQKYLNKNEKLNTVYIDNNINQDILFQNNQNVIKKAKTNLFLNNISNYNKTIGLRKLSNDSNDIGMKYISSPRNIINKQLLKRQEDIEMGYIQMNSERKTNPYINVKKIYVNNNYPNISNDNINDDEQFYNNKIAKKNTFIKNINNKNDTLMNKIYKDFNNIKRPKRIYKLNNTPDFKNNKLVQDSLNINENIKKINKKKVNQKFIKIPNNFHLILSTSHNIDNNGRLNTDTYIDNNNNLQSERIERRNKKIYTRKNLRECFQNNKTFYEQNNQQKKIIESFDEDNYYLNSNNSKENIRYNRNYLTQLEKFNSINETNNQKLIKKMKFNRLNRKELIEKVKEINDNNRAKYNPGKIASTEKKAKSNNIIYMRHSRNKTNDVENNIKKYKISDIKRLEDVNKMNKSNDETFDKKYNIIKDYSKNINRSKDSNERRISFIKSISYDMENISTDNKNIIVRKQKSQKNKRNIDEIVINYNKSKSKKNQQAPIPISIKRKVNIINKFNKSKDKKRLEICNVSNIKIGGRYKTLNNNNLKFNKKKDSNKNDNSNKIIINNNIPKNEKLNINNIVNINIIKQNNSNNSDKQNKIENNVIKDNINNINSINKKININNSIINNNSFSINNNKSYIYNAIKQIEKQNIDSSDNQNAILNKIIVPQNIIHLSIKSDKKKERESELNTSENSKYNNTDNNINNIETIKPVIQHKIERNRPVYSLPPSQKRSVSQGKPFNLINKYYDENFILEDDDEENIKLNDDSCADSEVKTSIKILNNQNAKNNNLANILNNYLIKENENINLKNSLKNNNLSLNG